jgi:hypothetical protein
MTCHVYNSPDGKFSAIICSRGHRAKACTTCGKPAGKLCDFKLSGKKAGKTCDRPICERCAKSTPNGKGDTHDLCGIHAGAVTPPITLTLPGLDGDSGR